MLHMRQRVRGTNPLKPLYTKPPEPTGWRDYGISNLPPHPQKKKIQVPQITHPILPHSIFIDMHYRKASSIWIYCNIDIHFQWLHDLWLQVWSKHLT